MTESIMIGEHEVGGGRPALVIAEIAQAHEGSLGNAHAFVDAAADAGADAVKFQTHIARAESTLDEAFRVPMSGQDETRYDYWARMEFTAGQWEGLARHAGERGLLFLSSAFSLEAVDLLGSMGMPAWKVGSGEFRTGEIVRAMAATGRPVLLSTGMSTYAEIEKMAALARGADLIEVHVTFDRRLYGPDAAASLTFEELAFVVRARDAFGEMDGAPVDKDGEAERLGAVRELFSRSLAPGSFLAAGTVLEAGMLAAKKPGSGIPSGSLEKVVGRRLKRDVGPERLLRWEDLE